MKRPAIAQPTRDLTPGRGNVCLCGAGGLEDTGAVHAADCLRPFFYGDELAQARWHQERAELIARGVPAPTLSPCPEHEHCWRYRDHVEETHVLTVARGETGELEARWRLSLDAGRAFRRLMLCTPEEMEEAERHYAEDSDCAVFNQDLPPLPALLDLPSAPRAGHEDRAGRADLCGVSDPDRPGASGQGAAARRTPARHNPDAQPAHQLALFTTTQEGDTR